MGYGDICNIKAFEAEVAHFRSMDEAYLKIDAGVRNHMLNAQFEGASTIFRKQITNMEAVAAELMRGRGAYRSYT